MAMVDLLTVGRLFAGVVLLFGNGYFVTIEFAMTRVRQFPEAEFQGSRGLERAWQMTERLEIFLSGCQLGITICSVGLGVVAEPALAAIIDPLLTSIGVGTPSGSAGHSALSAIVALAIINLLHLTVGEQAPTYLGIERTKLITRYGAPILYWWTTLLSPIIRLADWLAKAILSLFGVTITRSWADEELDEVDATTRGEVLSQMGEVLTNLEMSPERRREVINAVAIDQIQAADIMVPREEIVAVSTSTDFQTALATMHEQPHTRFPLVGDTLDHREGILYLPAVVRELELLEDGDQTLSELAAPPLTVASDLPVSDLIDEFQAADQELAFVVDNGRTVGIVTTTDAFEVIAGELEDPLDEEL